ncbi:MAG: hypothetical protein IPM34_09385 [Saprospiraceae bacterium]|nr:hypothetical protein [Saprospiraceae bacterium]
MKHFIRFVWVIAVCIICSNTSLSQWLKWQDQFTPANFYAECLYATYAEKLDSFYSIKSEQNLFRMDFRSASENMDVRIYVDTSYERRRTGAYNQNDSVIFVLNQLIANIQNDFNAAADDWDIIIEPEYVFFDGQTPFSYGSSIAETLINFYDWVDAQGYPGSRDTYIFYTGHYTNQGISFVDALCLPGGALVGFVQDEDSNEDLSSHEWIGHAAGSLHYNNEVNIMNSIAHRPWNQPSLEVIQDFLDNQSCVENVQSMLDANEIHFELQLEKDLVTIRWNLGFSCKELIIERKLGNQEWLALHQLPFQKSGEQYNIQDRLKIPGNYYYRLKWIGDLEFFGYSQIKHVEYTAHKNLRINTKQIINEGPHELLIRDLSGKLIWRSNEKLVSIESLQLKGMFLVMAGSENLKLAVF